MKFNYYIPTRVIFGKGSLDKLKKVKLPGKKALIVTGGSSTTKLGFVDRTVALLKEAGADAIVYNKILPNPEIWQIGEGAALAKAENCDFIVGLGGGSSIDSAKAIAIAAANEGGYWDYVVGGSGGKKPFTNVLPIIAITTTAGTGTEADPWTVITNPQTNEKIGFGNDKVFPMVSIVDPDLMKSVPKLLTAYQGFDALFHATEGYIVTIANPMSDMYALKSIELIGKSIVEAVNNGDNDEARANIALANTLSGFVQSTSACASKHSMEHSMSAFYPKLPHGAGLIMICIAYYTFFAFKTPQRFIDMAKALGKKEATKPMDFVEQLQSLLKACGVDDLKMSDYGIQKEDMRKFAEHARTVMGNLFKIDPAQTTLEDTVKMFEDSYK